MGLISNGSTVFDAGSMAAGFGGSMVFIKKLTADPWKDLVSGFEAGTKVEGKVVRWNSNGVFVELKKDVTGLIPLAQFEVSEYSELKVKEGEKITGEVVSINYDSHRIMLKKEGFVEAPKEEAVE